MRRRRIDPLWRKAPTVLLRYPSLLGALAFGALLLVVAVASYPLFLSATTSDLVRAAIERPNITRYGAGMTFTYAGLSFESRRLELGLRSPDPADLDEAFGRLAAASPVLDEPVAAVLADAVTVSLAGGGEIRQGRLFSSTGVLDEVDVLSGADGDGVWLPDLIADALGAGAGDTIELGEQNGRIVRVTVDGVYRGVYQTSMDGYWLRWQDAFAVPCPDCAPPAQPILADPEQLVAVAGELRQDKATFSWQAPIADPGGLSLEDAAEFQRYEREILARVSDVDDPLGRLFGCCRTHFFFGRVSTDLTSSIGFVIFDARTRIAAVEGPTRVLQIAGITVALVVSAAAGAFSLRARRVEAAWMFARGASPVSVALKTSLESLLPCVAGGMAGFGAALAAVAALGPQGDLDGSAIAQAAGLGIVAVGAAVALIAASAGWAYVRVVDPHGRRFARAAALVPWELAIAGLAFVALGRLRRDGAFLVDASRDIVKPSLTLVAFPFLLLGGFALLGARMARLGVARLRGPTARSRPPTYLATRRLGGGGALTTLLVGAAGLCLGTFLHAQIIARSLETTVDAKARVFVGSDVQARIDYQTPIPEAFPYPLTRVVRFRMGARLPSDRALDVMAVDSRTFAAAAYWNGAFAGEPLEDMTARLRGSSSDAVPALLAGGGAIRIDEVRIAQATVRIAVVARASAFPGMSSLNPLLVVDEATLLERIDLPFNPLNDPRATTELWAKGDPDRLELAFAATEYPPYSYVTAEEIKDVPYIAAAIDTFVVVNGLGLIAAALTIVGMLMYLQARERSQVVSYALSSRMGMTHAQHRRALLFELGAMLLWALSLGAVLAVIAARLTVPLLDPIPAVPPEPFLVLPLLVGALAAAVVGGLAWLGAAWTNRRARTVNLAEVMRVAE